MNEEQQRRALDLAYVTALTELVRIAIAEMAFSSTSKAFREKLTVIEKLALDSLGSRPLPEAIDEEMSIFVKKAASGYLNRVIASISFPGDDKLD